MTILLFFSCLTAPRPKWIEDYNLQEFDHQNNLYGVGISMMQDTGEAYEDACEQASRQVASSIETRIQSFYEKVRTVQMTTGEDMSQVNSKKIITKNSLSQTNLTISGIECVKEHRVDKKTYVMATLPMQNAIYLLSRIQSSLPKDTKTQTLYGDLEKELKAAEIR